MILIIFILKSIQFILNFAYAYVLLVLFEILYKKIIHSKINLKNIFGNMIFILGGILSGTGFLLNFDFSKHIIITFILVFLVVFAGDKINKNLIK